LALVEVVEAADEDQELLATPVVAVVAPVVDLSHIHFLESKFMDLF
jgi:hypothetical protein